LSGCRPPLARAAEAEMGSRGPAPKPTARKKLEGTYRKDRAPKHEARPESGVPAPPEWLPDGARAEWNRIVPEMERIGLATGVDYWALVAYCEAFDRYQQLGEKIALMDGDRYQVSESGWRQAQPEVAEQKELVDRMAKLASKLGISPADRTKVEALPRRDEDGDKRMALVK
jgi:P27 family predicted phage terminase small subunit